MTLTDEEHEFIAHWLLEFGDGPVTYKTRFDNKWYGPMPNKSVIQGILTPDEGSKKHRHIKPAILALFKGEQNE